MYDAVASPRQGDQGLAFHGSSLRPEDPLAAYETVKKGWTVDEIVIVLGGYQEDSENENYREIRWQFQIDSGTSNGRRASLDISIRFKNGNVDQKLKTMR